MPVDESNITIVERMLTDMEKGVYNKELVNECPELAQKMLEHEKLKYRLNMLKRATSNSSEDPTDKKRHSEFQPTEDITNTTKYCNVQDYGDSIIEKLNFLFMKGVNKAFPDLKLKFNVKETINSKYGDYQFDGCMQISRRLSNERGNKVGPHEVAKKIVENLEVIPLIEKYEPVNAYINVFVCKKHLGKKMAEIFAKGISMPKICKRHVIVDFSSPNIAKQMHVGHLRSTIIGESISRLLESVGFTVLRLNHIGDWGTQFGMLVAYLRQSFPNYLKEPPQIHDLQAFYKASKKKFDEDAEFKSLAYQCVVKLQNFEPEIVDAWQMICDVSRRDLDQIYHRLDVQLVERGESFYQTRMQLLIKDLEAVGVLLEEEGRKLFFPDGFKVPLTLVKSDGGFTYDTSDLAAIKQRIFEEKADWVLYVVDMGQSEHLETIFAAARKFGWYDPKQKRVEHVQFGLVLGEDKKKFKTRSGDTVKLKELLDEGVRRAEEKLRSKEKDKEFTNEEFVATAESLAFGCIKYADLSQSRTADYVFSFDRMLDDRGNTAVYLLYAYTRIRSIARNAQITRDKLIEYLKELEEGVLPLDHPRELRLAKHILKFSDCMLSALESLHLNKICDYIYELATIFHDFYKECYVVSKQQDGSGQLVTKINFNRLLLCEITADVMHRCFHILGIRTIDRM